MTHNGSDRRGAPAVAGECFVLADELPIITPKTPADQARSWRDVLPVHPAADLFPMMSPDELIELGEDIRKNGLQFPIVILPVMNGDKIDHLLLDGRNRLDAMAM